MYRTPSYFLVLAAILVSGLALPAAAQSYCIPQISGFNCATDEYIANVTVSDLSSAILLNNSSACSGAQGYEDFTATVPPLALGTTATYQVSVTVGQYWTGDRVGIWIDTNQNASFEDSGELVAILASSNPGNGTTAYTLNGAFTVAVNTLAGPTRLRARLCYFGFPNPASCATTYYGNVEDYAVVVSPNVIPEYQVNQATSNLTVDGVTGGAYLPAIVSKCTTQAGLISFGTSVPSALWEAAVTLSPLVPASNGGVTLPGGNVVNLGPNDPTLAFLWGGSSPTLVPFLGNFTSIFTTGSLAGTVSIQQICVHHSLPYGFAMSQGCQVNVAGNGLPPTPIAGPTGDDSEVQVNAGCVPFFNRAFSTLFVESNGRLMFGAGNTAWSPTVSQFAADAPSFGCWTDMNPASGGTISIGSPAAGILAVAYANVPYYGTSTANSFTLQLDTATGIASIIGLNTLGADPGLMLVGISGGNVVGATNPGATAFSPGGAGSGGGTFNTTDMTYAIGPRGAVTTGITRIDFVPNAIANYNWNSY